MTDLTVLVLAGGAGSRFWPFTTNKILFPFLDKSMWEYSLQRVLPKETSRVLIVTSPENDAILSHISLSVPVETVVQPNAGGMAEAVILAKDKITAEKLLILIADDIFDQTLPQKIVQTADETHAFAVIPGWQVSSYFPGGYLQLEGKRITGIIEKPDPDKTPSNLVNISGHYISDASLLFAALTKVQSAMDDHYEQALTLLMKEKEFTVLEYTGVFTSLKYPWHVLDVMDVLLSELQSFKGENCQIKPNVFIEGPVYIGNNVRIFENTKIVGPVYIGDNTIIGNNNVIRHSIIGSDCVTGFNTDITRSYVGNSCWFHSNYIGDSVLEGNISMGSGSVLANLRLDEGDIYSLVKGEKTNTNRTKLGALIGKNVRIGVNTSIMPGIKIGSGSFIGAGITLAEDINDTCFVTGKSQITIQPNTKLITNDRSEYKNKI